MTITPWALIAKDYDKVRRRQTITPWFDVGAYDDILESVRKHGTLDAIGGDLVPAGYDNSVYGVFETYPQRQVRKAEEKRVAAIRARSAQTYAARKARREQLSNYDHGYLRPKWHYIDKHIKLMRDARDKCMRAGETILAARCAICLQRLEAALWNIEEQLRAHWAQEEKEGF